MAVVGRDLDPVRRAQGVAVGDAGFDDPPQLVVLRDGLQLPVAEREQVARCRHAPVLVVIVDRGLALARLGHRLGPSQRVVGIVGREGVVDVGAGFQPSRRVVPVVGPGPGQGHARRVNHPGGIGSRPVDAGQTVIVDGGVNFGRADNAGRADFYQIADAVIAAGQNLGIGRRQGSRPRPGRGLDAVPAFFIFDVARRVCIVVFVFVFGRRVGPCAVRYRPPPHRVQPARQGGIVPVARIVLPPVASRKIEGGGWGGMRIVVPEVGPAFDREAAGGGIVQYSIREVSSPLPL